MPLYGPDGKPLMGGRVIGGPKSLADLPLMTDDVVDAMAIQAEGLLSQGTPLEVPVAMPQAILFGMIRTLKHAQGDRKMLEKALGTLRFRIQTSVYDPEEPCCDIGDLAMALRKHLKSEPLEGEYPDPTPGPDAA
mgnify:FL=1